MLAEIVDCWRLRTVSSPRWGASGLLRPIEQVVPRLSRERHSKPATFAKKSGRGMSVGDGQSFMG